MKNIRKFETTVEMESAVLEEVSINYNVETDGLLTFPSVIQPMKNYFRFVAVEDSNISLNGVDMETMAPVCDINLQYNKNGDGWIDWDFTSIHLSAGETLYLRGNNENGFSKLDMNTGTGRLYMFTDLTGSNNGSTTGVYECHGDIMSLVYGDDFVNHSAIPNDGCFAYMFALCDGLLTSPELTAEALTDACYMYMFMNCVNLKEITMLAGEIPSEMCLFNWVASISGNGSGVSETGTFYKNPACELPIASDENGYGGIPEGWDVVESAKLNECISLAIVADDVHYGNETTTTVHYTAIGNHRDESGNITVSGIIVTGVTESDPFPQNLSTTETVQREVTFTYMGCTAKTVVTHGVFVPYEEQYLTFKTINPGTFAYENDISYSLDYGNTWEILPSNEETPLIPSGKHVLWKKEYADGSTGACFRSSGSFKVFGNIMSLSYGDNFIGQTSLEGKNYSHSFLFAGCTRLIDASALCLPATTLAEGCYENMFYGCTSLTTAPELPATTLENNCYYAMFASCTSLTTVPSLLPATTLTEKCYYYMFNGCTSLTTAPELPAITLANNCYYYMFNGCTSLTTAPELPATTLDKYCYHSMFHSCTSLTTAPELPATTLAEGCYCGMFSGCENLTIAPELPSTTLAEHCYDNMFYGCTSLTTAPELPATTLVNHCYQYMFENCSSLNHITMLATDISANSCLVSWVKGVSSNGTFIKSCEHVTLPIGPSGIPSGWTIENAFEIEAVSLSITGDNVEFYMTSTTIHYESVVNLYNKDGEVVDTITVNGTAQSEPFPINTSETDIVERTISFSFYGKTATTTISQDKYSHYYYDYTTFEALEDGTFSFKKKGTGNDIQYSKDNGTTWSTLASDENVSVVTGDKVMWKSTITPEYDYGIGKFSSTNKFNVCGNIMSLLYGDNFIGQTSLKDKSYAFYDLFNYCSFLIDASNLILPATTLANSCYSSMFFGCSGLTTAPELPATTLVRYCYSDMFQGCTSLTTAPELPATTLVYSCYYGMFEGCTSLTTAPELPATTLVDSCYSYMFKGCTSLNHITMLATNISADSCLKYWVQNVPRTGTFVKHPDMDSLPTGVSGIPNGWTIEDAVL